MALVVAFLQLAVPASLITIIVSQPTTLCIWDTTGDEWDRYNGEYTKQSDTHNSYSWYQQSLANSNCPTSDNTVLYAAKYGNDIYWQVHTSKTVNWAHSYPDCEDKNIADPTTCSANQWIIYDAAEKETGTMSWTISSGSCPSLACGRIEVTNSGVSGCNRIFTKHFSEDYVFTYDTGALIRYLYFNPWTFKWYCSNIDGHLDCGDDGTISHQKWSSSSDGWKDMTTIGDTFTLAVSGGNTATFTCLDTLDPTSHPTKTPTADPTTKPTLNPTDPPTSNPTVSPTKNPTTNPTESPTKKPTSNPTETTQTPTKAPTNDPTKKPTDSPTKTPTKAPTKSPTQNPTKYPTETPTVSPTKFPTVPPTKFPTEYPSIPPTKFPTKTPTKAPTNFPSIPPTKAPTNIPTTTPTKAPTNPPTKSPTREPTESPTRHPSSSPTSLAERMQQMEYMPLDFAIMSIIVGGAIICGVAVVFLLIRNMLQRSVIRKQEYKIEKFKKEQEKAIKLASTGLQMTTAAFGEPLGEADEEDNDYGLGKTGNQLYEAPRKMSEQAPPAVKAENNVEDDAIVDAMMVETVNDAPGANIVKRVSRMANIGAKDENKVEEENEDYDYYYDDDDELS